LKTVWVCRNCAFATFLQDKANEHKGEDHKVSEFQF
jgi:uncharacterized protein (DUF2225 family)